MSKERVLYVAVKFDEDAESNLLAAFQEMKEQDQMGIKAMNANDLDFDVEVRDNMNGVYLADLGNK